MRQHRPPYQTRDLVYAFILDYCRAHYVPPSLRDIGRALGISSTSVVAYHVQALLAEGQLVRVGPEGAWRAVVPAELVALVVRERSVA